MNTIKGGWAEKVNGKWHYFWPHHSLCWRWDIEFTPKRQEPPPEEACCHRCWKRYSYRKAHGRIA